MNTTVANTNASSKVEQDFPSFFGEWVKHRRIELGLSQAQLSSRACCSIFALRKIESSERRPSRQLAGLLAEALGVHSEDQVTFIRVARGELPMERLAFPDQEPGQAGKTGPAPVNLPKSLTPFIGREQEISALAHLLQDPQCALLTILGPGGIGKTRLAIEVAGHSADLFPDGIWFVTLTELNSPDLLIQAIADSAGFKFQDPANHQAQLLHFLRDKKALLLLDNGEYVRDSFSVLTAILAECRQIKLFVTSRERLNLLSEWVFEIQGLAVPPNDRVEQFESYSSVALFLQSARRIQANFELQKEERQWVLQICQTMEGMPLGIELSAAWVGILSCEAIAQEIEHNLDFLSVSLRDIPERHRSLRATLDHSWKLLNPEERQILSRLSVFRSRFRREAAEEICGANIGILSSLKNKTLLYRTGQDYYALHEVIRQYAALKLAEDPIDNEFAKDMHASYFVQNLAQWEKGIKSSRQLEIFKEMSQILGDLAQGWLHLITHCRIKDGKSSRFCPELIHSALFSISLFYEMRCRNWEAINLFTESVDYLKSVRCEFEGTDNGSQFDSVLGHVTAYLGLHHFYILDYRKARKLLEESLCLLDESHSSVERAQAQIMLAAFDYRQGNFSRSISLHEQSREIFRRAGVGWWYQLSLINLARSYLSLGRVEECEALYQEAFQLVVPGDLRLELMLRIGFARARYLQNDFVGAERAALGILENCYQYESHRVIVYSCNLLSEIALSTNRVELAEKYLQESTRLLGEIGETDELAFVLLYQGKCLATRSEPQAARAKFGHVIRIARALDIFYLVYWALMNIARTYLDEGNTDKALEIALILVDCPVEYKIALDEGVRLFADLQPALAQRLGESTLGKAGSKMPPDQVVDYALRFVPGFNKA